MILEEKLISIFKNILYISSIKIKLSKITYFIIDNKLIKFDKNLYI